MKPLFLTPQRRPRPSDLTTPRPEVLAFLEDCAAGHAYHYWRRYSRFLDLEDTTQEALMAIYRARDTWRPGVSAFGSWATGCIINALREYRRKMDGRPRPMQERKIDTPPQCLPALSLDEQPKSLDPDGDPVKFGDTIRDTRPGPEDLATDALAKQALAREVERLPERERRVFKLYFWEDWTFKAIGEVLAVSESRVFQLYKQGLKRLQLSMGAMA